MWLIGTLPQVMALLELQLPHNVTLLWKTGLQKVKTKQNWIKEITISFLFYCREWNLQVHSCLDFGVSQSWLGLLKCRPQQRKCCSLLGGRVLPGRKPLGIHALLYPNLLQLNRFQVVIFVSNLFTKQINNINKTIKSLDYKDLFLSAKNGFRETIYI